MSPLLACLFHHINNFFFCKFGFLPETAMRLTPRKPFVPIPGIEKGVVFPTPNPKCLIEGVQRGYLQIAGMCDLRGGGYGGFSSSGTGRKGIAIERSRHGPRDRLSRGFQLRASRPHWDDDDPRDPAPLRRRCGEGQGRAIYSFSTFSSSILSR